MELIKIAILCLLATQYKPVVIDPNYAHDKWDVQPKDIVREFRAYTVSFDGPDDDIMMGLPEWVAYEIKPSQTLKASPRRPSPWISSDGSPRDDTYKGSGFSRGHLCMAHHAWRLGANAHWNTHTTLNACPQIQEFNAGIWLDIEKKCGEWADKSNRSVWVITGPVIYGRPHFIGDKDELLCAVPDAFFKIIVRETDTLDVLALLYPHKVCEENDPYPHAKYLVSVDYIEMVTRLDFFTNLPDEIESKLESRRAYGLWGESRYMQMKK
jgi:DNA/RNA endonuclease G (NUC1)